MATYIAMQLAVGKYDGNWLSEEHHVFISLLACLSLIQRLGLVHVLNCLCRFILSGILPNSQALEHMEGAPGIHCSCMCENLRKNVSKRIRKRPESHGKK